MTSRAPVRVLGEAILYRLFDVGYEILLDRAYDVLSSSGPERRKPVRGEAQAIQIANPPVTVHVGTETVDVGGRACEAEVSTRLFDFGVLSMRARIRAPGPLAWDDFAAFGVAAGSSRAWSIFEPCRDRLLARLAPAVVRPAVATVTEEYMVFRVHRLEDGDGRPLRAEALDDAGIERILVGEGRPLSTEARKDLLSQRFSYFDDDLAVLSWSSALVVESAAEDTDVQYVLEFANAQLLELRFYDSILDAELPRMYDEIQAARRGFHFLGRRFSRLLAGLQTRVADATEAVERAENALKVTEDVFLARIYAAALEIFRGRTWRQGIDRKVAIMRDAYTMLNAESQARRAEILEIIIVGLIALEIALALVFR